MRSDIIRLAQSATTNITLYSDKGKWTPGYPGKPSFTFAGGTGDAVTEQCILDPNTAVLGIKTGTSGLAITLTDTVNNEAVSLIPMTSSQFTSLGQSTQQTGQPMKRNAANSDKKGDK